MRVRFTEKYNATLGLVQEQQATVVDFVFDPSDQERYRRAGPGEVFRPTNLPAGIWLQVDDFKQSPVWQSMMPYMSKGGDPMQGYKTARGLLCLPLMEAEFKWKSTQTHHVKRFGFMLTHAHFLTTTASQGRTLRAGVTIDCARLEPTGVMGASDDTWWLNLYVMFSRATQMSDMLLLRPPPRELLERGPPAGVSQALARFSSRRADCVRQAEILAERLGFQLPVA